MPRKYIGKKKTYRVSDFDNEMFSRFAKEIGKTRSELVREFIIRFNAENLAEKLVKKEMN